MKTPARCPKTLLDDGVIDEVIRSLRKEQEANWKNAEVEALYRFVAAGVRVPKPFGHCNDTLITELVTDTAGNRAPRLGGVDLTPVRGRQFQLIKPIPAFLVSDSNARRGRILDSEQFLSSVHAGTAEDSSSQ